MRSDYSCISCALSEIPENVHGSRSPLLDLYMRLRPFQLEFCVHVVRFSPSPWLACTCSSVLGGGRCFRSPRRCGAVIILLAGKVSRCSSSLVCVVAAGPSLTCSGPLAACQRHSAKFNDEPSATSLVSYYLCRSSKTTVSRCSACLSQFVHPWGLLR